MKNLIGSELKESFKEQLLNALAQIKNLYATIVFKFSEEDNSYKFPDVKITYAGGELTFNEVRLGHMSNQYVIDIILKNMTFDVFTFIRSDYQHGEVSCHGYGEYWGEDTITIIYHRFKENK